jgi:hypothetical protein
MLFLSEVSVRCLWFVMFMFVGVAVWVRLLAIRLLAVRLLAVRLLAVCLLAVRLLAVRLLAVD